MSSTTHRPEPWPAERTQDDPWHVVVEGPIGVGKTTLARRLADSLAAGLLLEAPHENPFLERFYRDPRGQALPTQLHFLLQRAQQVGTLAHGDLFERVRVSDFLLDKDALFAELTLDADELALYRAVHRQLVPDVPSPDLVVYLQAPVAVLQARIERRGIAFERGMDTEYLQRLADAYMRFFHSYDRAPLLIVNAATANFADNDDDYTALLEQIRRTRSGRHFFNPSALGDL